MEAARRTVGDSGSVSGENLKENASSRTFGGGRRTTSIAMSTRRRSTCIKVGLSDTDHEGARRCAITKMQVGNGCSLCCGSSTSCSERVDHESVLMVNFTGKCVSIEQDGPF